MPVFAKEQFLRAIADECGWLGWKDESGALRCLLPYTIVRKAGLRLVRFRTQTIPCADQLGICEEKLFLNSVVDHFRRTGADIIIPPSNNAIFRTYPDGADAAPYGTYVIDLRQSEESLWRNIGRITRQNISTAQRDGVTIRKGTESLEPAYELIRETFGRSRIPFMKRDDFIRYAAGLGEHAVLMVAEYKNVVQSYCLFGFSKHCAYAIYGGNVPDQHQGSFKLLLWEAIRHFRQLGVCTFDFFGARLMPVKGSKQEGINQMKKRFGASLTEGYLWKQPLRPLRSLVYSVAVRLLRGGDIVDQERHKLEGYVPGRSA